ncbi:MAG: HAD family hydrolase [Syntrophales bacterium]|nr:HAD family hydrolase [Syntrophales bacterium]
MGKLLLFDYDGVLVESLEHYYEKVKRALELIDHKFVRTVEDYLTLFEDNFYTSLAKHGVDLNSFLEAIKKVEPPSVSMHVHPFIIPIVKKLATDWPLVIISSNAQESILPLLKEADILSCFHSIMGAETALSKEEKINSARRQYGAKREETYYVGDTVGDIKEGKAAGVTTIAVTWGWHKIDRLVNAQADFLIEEPEDLIDILKK